MLMRPVRSPSSTLLPVMATGMVLPHRGSGAGLVSGGHTRAGKNFSPCLLAPLQAFWPKGEQEIDHLRFSACMQ